MVSQKYILQLVEDIQQIGRLKARGNSTHNHDHHSENDIEAYFTDVDKYLDFDETTAPTFGQIIGLEKIQFPDAKLLLKDQIIALLDPFKDLLKVYNVIAELPKAMPLEDQYTLTLSLLNESIYLSDYGCVTWDFCSGESKNCLLGKYCSCIEIEQEMKQNTNDAQQLLNDIIESCKNLILKHGSMELRHSLSPNIQWSPLSMFIAGGSEFVPFEVYQCPNLKQACDAIILLFSLNPELESCFMTDDKFNIHKNLEVILSLNVDKYEGNLFYVEPFYIENSVMLKQNMSDHSN